MSPRYRTVPLDELPAFGESRNSKGDCCGTGTECLLKETLFVRKSCLVSPKGDKFVLNLSAGVWNLSSKSHSVRPNLTLKQAKVCF